MSIDLERLLQRCEGIEKSVAQTLRIDELEREIFRRDVKKAHKRWKRRRREALRVLAEVDRLAAAITRLSEAGPANG